MCLRTDDTFHFTENGEEIICEDMKNLRALSRYCGPASVKQIPVYCDQRRSTTVLRNATPEEGEKDRMPESRKCRVSRPVRDEAVWASSLRAQSAKCRRQEDPCLLKPSSGIHHGKVP